MDISPRTKREFSQLKHQHVSRATFVDLLTSHKQLKRLDDIPNDLRGLVDDDGNWFVIDQGRLRDAIAGGHGIF